MKEKFDRYGLTVWLVYIILGCAYAFTWIVTCGVIKVITLCFGWDFSWFIATGIWLIMVLLKDVFKRRNSHEYDGMG